MINRKLVEETLKKLNPVFSAEEIHVRCRLAREDLIEAATVVLQDHGHQKGSTKFNDMVSQIEDSIEYHTYPFTEAKI